MTHYNPNKQIYVASDASNFGLGAVILHKEESKLKPIQHVSRTLLPAETIYLQIEKVGLAIVFAITIFHKYLHGREFILKTDHRPLLAIFSSKKGVAEPIIMSTPQMNYVNENSQSNMKEQR